jgi:hypothetical protein
MSIFNPDTFLDEEQDELSTERVLIPTGVHAAFIESQEVKHGTSDEGVDWARLELKWRITEPSVLAELDRDKVYITQRIMLRIDEATGKLSTKKGDNYVLGQVRKAVGKPRGPLADLVGCAALIEVKHRVYEGTPQEDVKGVSAVE